MFWLFLFWISDLQLLTQVPLPIGTHQVCTVFQIMVLSSLLVVQMPDSFCHFVFLSAQISAHSF